MSSDYPDCFCHTEIIAPASPSATPLILRPIPAASGVARVPKFNRKRGSPYAVGRSKSDCSDSESDRQSSPQPAILRSTDTSVSPRAPRAIATGLALHDGVIVSRIAAVDQPGPAGTSGDKHESGSGSGETSSQKEPDISIIPTQLGARPDVIARPPGQASRPGRKGYTLETKLAWEKPVYKYIKKWVNTEVDQHLRVRPFSEQVHEVKAICQKAMRCKDMEFLKIYEDCWPIEELIRARLQVRKASHRNKAGNEAALRSLPS
ncbi:uncharacterized protein SCHCODRAFT_02492210 [Schizophyllum commune H4-8]|uniref:Uncharacterized protein n=1 Tax=Schizophyllum commune (strain H4-8 / FGSC 9210) TaxID=578458 RepID=D8PYZ6_SCHCM|nr:uncharacterized protein SCHCODRAFT_02492210 [Schizophyllum commune H4-8]KAI5896168.1 hypothetical protein SCHCODRAFT_02492210 [Schizophyllum commune H4-8]